MIIHTTIRRQMRPAHEGGYKIKFTGENTTSLRLARTNVRPEQETYQGAYRYAMSQNADVVMEDPFYYM